MKITDVRTTTVAVPQKRSYKSSWRRSYQGTGAQQAVIVEVITDEGLIGLGESPVVYAGSAEVTTALLAGVRDLVIGSDPLEHELLRRRIYAETGMAHLGTQGLSWAISGLDIAMWDLAGRIFGQPLHRIWGGAWRTTSSFYADIPPAEPTQMAAEAQDWVARGFGTVYLKVGFDPDLDVARVRAIREAVGASPRIRIDANQAWSPAAAKRILGRLAELDLEYVEQPIPASNLDGLAELRRAVAVPILAHEASLTVEGSLNVIKREAADALQLDPRFDAGISGARLAAGLAETAGLPVVTHTFGELGIATAAFLQLHAAHPNFILDNQTYYWNLTDDVISGGLMEFTGSTLPVPTSSGIGVELDRDRVAHYAGYYAQEVRDRRIVPPPDPYYGRQYLLRPRAG